LGSYVHPAPIPVGFNFGATRHRQMIEQGRQRATPRGRRAKVPLCGIVAVVMIAIVFDGNFVSARAEPTKVVSMAIPREPLLHEPIVVSYDAPDVKVQRGISFCSIGARGINVAFKNWLVGPSQNCRIWSDRIVAGNLSIGELVRFPSWLSSQLMEVDTFLAKIIPELRNPTRAITRSLGDPSLQGNAFTDGSTIVIPKYASARWGWLRRTGLGHGPQAAPGNVRARSDSLLSGQRGDLASVFMFP
jgi:hypothetical protein